MNTYFKIRSTKLVFLCVLLSEILKGQCSLGPLASTLAPTSGTAFVTSVNYNPGSYFAFPVLSGGSYAISTCGASINTQLTGWDAAGTNTVFFNDDNGPLCAGSQASIDNYIPGFTAFVKVQVSEFNCLPNGTSSINLMVRQNNNLLFTSASTPMCPGQTRTLSATPANVGTAPGNYGDPGTFSGPGISANVFTAPPVTSATNYTITYTFGYVSQTQTITVNPVPLISSSASHSVICGGATVTLNGSGASTYTWTGGAVNGTPFTPTSTASYSVTGTSADGCTGTNTSVQTITVNPSPTISVVSSKSITCKGESVSLSAGGVTTFTWNTNSNAAVITVSPTSNTTYTVSGSDSKNCSNTAVYTQTVSDCVGINALSITDEWLNIYPNPNNGLFSIHLSTGAKIIVFNTLGQEILNEEFQPGKQSLDIQSQSRGIYFVKVIRKGEEHILKLLKE